MLNRHWNLNSKPSPFFFPFPYFHLCITKILKILIPSVVSPHRWADSRDLPPILLPQWKMSGASVEWPQPRPCSGVKTFRRCRDRGDTDNLVLIDVDSDDFDDVIIIDVPESLRNKFRSSRVLREDGKGSWAAVICLDEEENAENINAHDGVKVDRNGASTSKSNIGSSSNGGVADDCEFIRENISPVKLSKGKRTYSGKGSSDSDYHDCELMEDSFCIREQWEKASWKRKCDSRNGQSGLGRPEMAFTEGRKNVSVANDCGRHRKDTFVGKDKGKKEAQAGSILKEDGSPILENLFPCGEADNPHRTDILTEERSSDNAQHLGSRIFEKDCSSSYAREDTMRDTQCANDELLKSPSDSRLVFDKDDPLLGEDGHAMLDLESCVFGEREKLKETDEYKKALEEELASRQRALQAQAEEAQNLRRQRKRERAEAMRLLDMERRQKQRIEEIRETQKKDVEDMNLKEVVRAAVRKEVDQLEQRCDDMASLLRGLGVLDGFGSHPSPNEVRLAYKKAVLTFHPDRASRSDIRQQVEAEEKFKLICRMKEKFWPA